MPDLFEEGEKLTGGDLTRYLQAKNVKLDCPACGRDDLYIMADGPDRPVHIFTLDIRSPERIAGNITGLVGVVCQHCGHLRTFMAWDVINWKEQETAYGHD